MQSRDPGSASRRGRAGALAPNRAMLLAAAAVIAVVAVSMAAGFFVLARDRPLPRATATPSLLGEAVPMGPATHVTSSAALEVTPGQPPSGGPHYATPLPAGIAAQPVDDGNAIHSLEHGLVWITYRADLVSPADLEALAAVARAHPADVILSPRPQNGAAASVVSWGRRLNLASPVPRGAVEAFVVANVNQSPEPGIR